MNRNPNSGAPPSAATRTTARRCSASSPRKSCASVCSGPPRTPSERAIVFTVPPRVGTIAGSAVGSRPSSRRVSVCGRVPSPPTSAGASLERVWENVRDWEHLPWLHRDSFASIDLEHEDERGWRARVGLRAPANAVVRLELAASDDRRYVARTLEGPGADTEIWTRLD